MPNPPEDAPRGLRKPNKRWYDKRPNVKQSVELLATFPDEILTIIAEGVNLIVEREYKANELLKSFKSLGTEKILGLYKSKNKMRSMDKNPTLHKTLNYFYIISEENQDAIAKQVLELVTIVRDYLQTCKESRRHPTSAQVVDLRNTYVSKGGNDTRRLLMAIRQEFLRQIHLEEEIIKSPTRIKDNTSGMKINRGFFDE